MVVLGSYYSTIANICVHVFPGDVSSNSVRLYKSFDNIHTRSHVIKEVICLLVVKIDESQYIHHKVTKAILW